MIDSRSKDALHPTLHRAADELEARLAKQGYQMKISSTYRDIEKQNQLYNDGITPSKGGQSMHNYRLAFDIFEDETGWDDEDFFKAVGKIWITMGGVWGGSWDSYDAVHCEFTNGLTWQQLKAGDVLPQDCKMKWEQTTIPMPTTTPPKAIPIQMKVNGVNITTSGYVQNGTSYIAARDFLNATGNSVNYVNDVIVVETNMDNIKMRVNDKSFTIEGRNINGHNYGALRDLLQKMGYSVSWENDTVLAQK